jgi:hypothetical protein
MRPCLVWACDEKREVSATYDGRLEGRLKISSWVTTFWTYVLCAAAARDEGYGRVSSSTSLFGHVIRCKRQPELSTKSLVRPLAPSYSISVLYHGTIFRTYHGPAKYVAIQEHTCCSWNPGRAARRSLRDRASRSGCAPCASLFQALCCGVRAQSCTHCARCTEA